MPRVRFRLPVTVSVTDSQLELLQAAAPLVRKLRDHAPELRAVKDSAVAFLREADAILKAEAKKRPKKPRRRRV